MRPIHEPAKATKDVRYMAARAKKDERFAQLVDRIREAATEFLAPAAMLQGATLLVAYELRHMDYAGRQAAAFSADQAAADNEEPEDSA